MNHALDSCRGPYFVTRSKDVKLGFFGCKSAHIEVLECSHCGARWRYTRQHDRSQTRLVRRPIREQRWQTVQTHTVN